MTLDPSLTPEERLEARRQKRRANARAVTLEVHAVQPLLNGLRARWKARDEHYRGWKLPMTAGMAAGVLAWRRSEADDLPAAQRELALADVARWTPPARLQ